MVLYHVLYMYTIHVQDVQLLEVHNNRHAHAITRSESEQLQVEKNLGGREGGMEEEEEEERKMRKKAVTLTAEYSVGS